MHHGHIFVNFENHVPDRSGLGLLQPPPRKYPGNPATEGAFDSAVCSVRFPAISDVSFVQDIRADRLRVCENRKSYSLTRLEYPAIGECEGRLRLDCPSLVTFAEKRKDWLRLLGVHLPVPPRARRNPEPLWSRKPSAAPETPFPFGPRPPFCVERLLHSTTLNSSMSRFFECQSKAAPSSK